MTTSEMTAPSSPPAALAAEYGTIEACLNRIRWRLFAVRTLERMALALAWAGLLAVTFVLARYLRQRYPAWAMLVTLLPAVLVGLYWAARLRWPGRMRLESPFCLVAGSGLTMALVLAGLIAWPFWTSLSPWVFCAAPLVIFAIAAVAMGRPVSPQRAAIFVDQHAGLEERVSTAYEWRSRPAGSEAEAAFAKPLVASAAAACQQVRSAKVGYARLDRRAYLAATACLAAAVGVSFLQPLPALGRRAGGNPAERVVAVQNATALAEALKEIERQQPAKDPAAEQNIAPLRDTVDIFKQRSDMSPLEQMAQMREARAKLAETRDRQEASARAAASLDKSPSLDDLGQAARRLADAKAQRAKNASGEPGKPTPAEETAQKDADAAAKAAAEKLAAGQMGEKEKQQMAEALEAAQAGAKGNPSLEKALGDASKALAENDGQKLEQALKDAAGQMGTQMGEQAVSGDAVKQAMDAIDQVAKGGQKGGGQEGSQGGSNGQENTQANGNQGAGQNGDQNGNQNGNPSANASSGKNQNGSGNQAGNPTENGNGSGQQAGTGQPSGTSGGASAQKGRGPETPGSTNFAQDGHAGGEAGTNATGGQSTMVKVYEERHVATAGPTTQISGTKNPLGKSGGSTEIMGPADRSKEPIVTYESQLPAARKMAMEQIEKQQIPPQYRDLIRNYYGQ